MPKPIKAQKVRFIKLGKNGCWTKDCLKNGTLKLDYRDVPEDAARSRDLEQLKSAFTELDFKKPSDHARQVADFFDISPHTLWITFHNGYLYWCFAKGSIEQINKGDEAAIDNGGAWLRHTKGRWRNTSCQGTELIMTQLSGQLTKTANYRGTICQVKLRNYLLGKLNDEPPKEVREAESMRDGMLRSIENLMKLLHWRDFEFLVRCIFKERGYRQVTPTIQSNKTSDMDLIMPITEKPAFVQVKTATNQAEFERYHTLFRGRPEKHLYYVYHTTNNAIYCPYKNVTLMDSNELAKQVLDAGLFNWLLEKAR